MKKVACIGGITVDIIVTPADSVPEPGTLRDVRGIEMHVGGCAANAALDIAKLGGNAALVCRLGKDDFGGYIKETCRKAGIDIRSVAENANSVTTGSVVCVSSSGERSFLYNPGSTADLTLSDMNPEVIAESDLIFVTSLFLMPEIDGKPLGDFLAEQRKKGKFTVADTSWDTSGRWLSLVEPLLPNLDLFMPSYDEAYQITKLEDPEKMADFFFDRGVKSVIIKIGKDGALICESREKKYVVPTWKKIKPVDTTGAGDSFCAGFLFGLSMDWDYAQCAEFANAVGTHCITAVGAQTGIRPMEEILKFMRETEK